MPPIHLTRRQFTAAVGTSISAFALAPWLQASTRRRDTFFEWKQLRPGVHAAFGQGGNAGLIQTDAGALLIDAKNAPYGTTLRREADAMGRPVSLLINTHHHADHTGGNHAFLLHDDAVGVMMHPKAKPRIEKQFERYVAQMKRARDQIDDLGGDVPEAAREEIRAAAERADELEPVDFAAKAPLPATMFDGKDVHLGDLVFSMTHVGPGHTDNDIYVFIAEHNLLHAGDLLFHKNHPFMDTAAGATSAGWITSCRAMLGVCDDETIVIPGHGEITDANGIRQQIRYFEVVREAAAGALADGLERDRFIQSDLPVFEGYGFTRIKERTLGTIYDEMVEQHKGGR